MSAMNAPQTSTPDVPVSVTCGRRPLAAALLAYAGLGPFLYYPVKRRKDSFLNFHFAQAGALWFVFWLLVAAFLAGAGIMSYVLVFYRDIYQGALHERTLLNFFRRAFLVWGVFLSFGAGSAVLGRIFDLPVLARLARRRWVVGTALVLQGFLLVILALLVPIAAYTSMSVRGDDGAADVVLLYEDIDRYPRWLFTSAYYPLTRVAQHRFGSEGVVVRKLTQESLAAAVQNARFVFVGSHGKAEGLLLDHKWFPPEGVAAMPKSEHLEFVYLASCDSGAQADAWRKAFAPAEVITYDRLTAVIEHVWWLWTEGPRRIRALS